MRSPSTTLPSPLASILFLFICNAPKYPKMVACSMLGVVLSRRIYKWRSWCRQEEDQGSGWLRRQFLGTWGRDTSIFGLWAHRERQCEWVRVLVSAFWGVLLFWFKVEHMRQSSRMYFVAASPPIKWMVELVQKLCNLQSLFIFCSLPWGWFCLLVHLYGHLNRRFGGGISIRSQLLSCQPRHYSANPRLILVYFSLYSSTALIGIWDILPSGFSCVTSHLSLFTDPAAPIELPAIPFQYCFVLATDSFLFIYLF